MGDNNAKFEGSNWSRLDQFIDYVPFVSIISNAVDLGMKGIAKKNLFDAGSQVSTTAKPIKQHYWTHIKNKSGWRIFFGCIPGIGNAILLGADLVRGIRYLAVRWNPKSLKSKDTDFQRDFMLTITDPKAREKYKEYLDEGVQKEFFGETDAYFNFGEEDNLPLTEETSFDSSNDPENSSTDEDGGNVAPKKRKLVTVNSEDSEVDDKEVDDSEEEEQKLFEDEERFERKPRKIPVDFSGEKQFDNNWTWHGGNNEAYENFEKVLDDKNIKKSPKQITIEDFKKLDSKKQIEFLKKDFNNIVQFLQYAHENVLEQEPFNDIRNLKWTSVSYQVKKIEENQKILFDASDKAICRHILKKVNESKDFLENQDKEFQLKVLKNQANKEVLLEYASDKVVNDILSTAVHNFLQFASKEFQLKAIQTSLQNLEKVSDEVIKMYIQQEQIKQKFAEKSELTQKEIKALDESRKRALKWYGTCDKEMQVSLLKSLQKEPDFNEIVKYFYYNIGGFGQQKALLENLKEINFNVSGFLSDVSVEENNKTLELKSIEETLSAFEGNIEKNQVRWVANLDKIEPQPKETEELYKDDFQRFKNSTNKETKLGFVKTFLDQKKFGLIEYICQNIAKEEKKEFLQMLVNVQIEDGFNEEFIKSNFAKISLKEVYIFSDEQEKEKIFKAMQKNKVTASYFPVMVNDLSGAHVKVLIDEAIQRKDKGSLPSYVNVMKNYRSAEVNKILKSK